MRPIPYYSRVPIIMLLLFTLAAARATEWHAVPPRVRSILRALGPAGLADVVDARGLLANQKITGAAAADARVAVYGGAWDPGFALVVVRTATGDPDWSWDRGLDAERSAAVGAAPDFDVATLPFWAAARGFDAGRAVEGFLRARRRPLGTGERRALRDVAPLWLEGPRAAHRARTYTARPGVGGWHPTLLTIHRHLAEPARDRWLARQRGAAVAYMREDNDLDFQNLLLRSLACTPFDQTPKRVAGVRRVDWIDLERHPAVRLDGISTIEDYVSEAGRCPRMTVGHLRALRDPEGRWPIFVYVGGRLVGMIKTDDDRSMLAVRNVVDARGHLTLAMGAVYRIDHRLKRRVDAAFESGSLHLNQLRVRPLSFLMTDYTWGPSVLPIIRPFLAPEHADACQIRLMDHWSSRRRGRVASRDYPRAWAALLDAIAARRDEVEESRASNVDDGPAPRREAR